MYVCAELNGAVCELWVQYSSLPVLSIQNATLIGFAFLALSATAYGIKIVAKTINPWS